MQKQNIQLINYHYEKILVIVPLSAFWSCKHSKPAETAVEIDLQKLKNENKEEKEYNG